MSSNTEKTFNVLNDTKNATANILFGRSTKYQSL